MNPESLKIVLCLYVFSINFKFDQLFMLFTFMIEKKVVQYLSCYPILFNDITIIIRLVDIHLDINSFLPV